MGQLHERASEDLGAEVLARAPGDGRRPSTSDPNIHPGHNGTAPALTSTSQGGDFETQAAIDVGRHVWKEVSGSGRAK